MGHRRASPQAPRKLCTRTRGSASARGVTAALMRVPWGAYMLTTTGSLPMARRSCRRCLCGYWLLHNAAAALFRSGQVSNREEERQKTAPQHLAEEQQQE